MALADITLNDGQGTPASHVFTYVSTQGNRVIRSDMSAPAEEPLMLTLAHQQTKIAGAVAKSHLVRFDKTVIDEDTGVAYKANVRIVMDIPNAILSDALIDDFSAYARNYFTEAVARLIARDSVG